jgi:hypothetical protein
MRTGFPTCDSKAIFFLVFVSFLGLLCTPSHILLTCVDEISRRIEGGGQYWVRADGSLFVDREFR